MVDGPDVQINESAVRALYSDWESAVGEIVRREVEIADAAAHSFVPHATGATFGSIHDLESYDDDGIIQGQVAARNPVSSVLNARDGVIRNRLSRRRPGVQTVRPAHPFLREALEAIPVYHEPFGDE